VKGVAADIKTAFPDMEQNAFGFTCDDPIEPNRVWYFVRPRGTFKGTFKTGTGKIIEPTGKKLIGPPEVLFFQPANDSESVEIDLFPPLSR
jgi:hypothetical protein